MPECQKRINDIHYTYYNTYYFSSLAKGKKMNGFLRLAKSGYNCSVKTHPPASRPGRPAATESQLSRHTQEQVEYVQLLVFQMNSHRIDLQLEEQNNNIDYKLL